MKIIHITRAPGRIWRAKGYKAKLAVLRGLWCRIFHAPVFVGLPDAGKYIMKPVSCAVCNYRWVEFENYRRRENGPTDRKKRTEIEFFVDGDFKIKEP